LALEQFGEWEPVPVQVKAPVEVGESLALVWVHDLVGDYVLAWESADLGYK